MLSMSLDDFKLYSNLELWLCDYDLDMGGSANQHSNNKGRSTASDTYECYFENGRDFHIVTLI